MEKAMTDIESVFGVALPRGYVAPQKEVPTKKEPKEPKAPRTDGNPWGITNGEARALDAVIATGSHKLAARELGLSFRTIETLAQCARNRMGKVPLIQACIQWDRWNRRKWGMHEPH